MMNSSFKQGDIGMHPMPSGEMTRDEMRQKLRNELNRTRYEPNKPNVRRVDTISS